MTRNQQGDFFGNDKKWFNFFRVIFLLFLVIWQKDDQIVTKLKVFSLKFGFS